MSSKTKQDEEALRDLREAIGRRIDDLRRERGMTAKALYDDMGWHKSEYSRKHRGETPVSDLEIVMLRRLLDAPALGWPYVSATHALLLDALGARAGEVLRNLQDVLALLDERRRR